MRPSAATSSRRRIAFAIAVALAALPLLPAAARAASYWVGNNGNPPCTHAGLQAAIDTAMGGAGHDTIFLVGAGPFTGPFSVLGSEVEIVGNVASCGSALSVGHSTLRAASGSRPLIVLSGAGGTVRLRRLVVTTQGGTFGGDGGAIWFAGASAASRLELVDSQVTGNTATGEGGGVYVSAGSLHVLGGTLVFANAAHSGGGIAARNGAVVELHGGSVVANTALFAGGGVFAPDARVVMENLSSQTATAVANNLAGTDGGGLYLAGDYDDTISALAGGPPSVVSGNQAQRGGGLFIDGGDVRMNYASLDNNHAAAEGGGAFLASGGLFSGVAPEAEPVRGGFPRLEANVAADGAAVYAAGGALLLRSGRVRGHQMAGGTGAVVAGAGSAVSILNGVVVAANVAPALFGIEGSGLLQLQQVSLAGNDVGGMVRWRGTESMVTIVNTAFDETEPLFAAFDPATDPPQLGCLLSRYLSPFAVVPNGSNLAEVSIADPQFVSPPNDLHLRHTSPAIDRCFEAPILYDLDGERRSYDDPYRLTAMGVTADVGTDEATVLFVDAFESGGLVLWSGDFP